MNLNSEIAPGQPAGAEGGLKVVATDRSIQIENLARQIEPWYKPALHRPRIDFRKRDTSRRHLRLLEPQRPADRDRAMLDDLHQSGALNFAQFGTPQVAWDFCHHQ